MKFVDFKKHQLIGKTVVYITNLNPKRMKVKTITKISEALSSGFRIESNPEKLFSYFTGKEILANGDKMAYAAISGCHLATDEQANEIRVKFTKLQEKKTLIEFIMSNESELHKISLESLERFVSEIKAVGVDKFKRENV